MESGKRPREKVECCVGAIDVFPSWKQIIIPSLGKPSFVKLKVFFAKSLYKMETSPSPSPFYEVPMSNCKINGTVHIFFLKKSYLSPRCPKLSHFFFPSVNYPLYLHVIIDFGHIWGPFMAEIEKMCQNSAFLVVPDFGYPQVVDAFVRKWWKWRSVSNSS